MSMRRIHVIRAIVAVLVLAGCFTSQTALAQNDKCFDAIYDARNIQLGDKVSYPSVGLGVSFGPDWFFPWPVYLRSGVNCMFSVKAYGADTPTNYRFEVPLQLMVLWDPAPLFSIGPYVGAYGALNLLVAPDDPARFNKWQYGVVAGMSMFVDCFHIYAGYYHDMIPFNKNGVGLDGIRVGVGLII